MMISLNQYLTEYEHTCSTASGLKAAVEDIARACVRIMGLVEKGPLIGIHGDAGEVNIQGENQQKLDILANEIFLECLASSGNWAGLASEELEDIYHIPASSPKGRFLCAFDPLDGSGNIDINMPIGTIFSILPYDKGATPSTGDFLRVGRDQVAAGYVLYGASTTLVLTLGQGVNSFTFDRSVGEFLLTQESMMIPDEKNYSINSSNYYHWYPPVRQYVDECLMGEKGVRGKAYNNRWMGCLVADSHRMLMKGGIFMLPSDKRTPDKLGHLRLLYECNPMSFIIEQAGGRSIAGDQETLDIQPESLHQRVALMYGSRTEIDYLYELHRKL